jgi:geranylgeranyl diphosphate synthase type I
MPLDFTPYLHALETEMRAAVSSANPLVAEFYGMLHYHLGWADENFQPAQFDGGKRLRPLFCLLVCETLCGDYRRALPAAAAIEILHNFSLVHDDIEDGDELRRGRKTLWTLVGVPHAINAGDALFAIAQRELLRLSERGISAERTLRASEIFQRTLIELVEGQYLDMRGETMSVETQHAASLLAYYKTMVGGKTASLLGASMALGAAVATDDAQIIKRCQEFGCELGLAFQMTDDLLGLWGDPAVTGKPVGADLRKKKKSLPIVLAQQAGGELGAALHHAFAQETLNDGDVEHLMTLMDAAAIRQQAEQEASKHRQRALHSWQRVVGEGVASVSAAAMVAELAEAAVGRAK